MDRREFLSKSCLLCLAASAGVAMASLSSCASSSVYKVEVKNNAVVVPSSLFTKSDLQIIRPDNYPYDIAVEKQKDGSYLALLLRCTHADNQLVAAGSGFTCSLHGSRFDEHGNVIKGPAAIPLKKFPARLSEQHIIIALG